MKPCIICHKIKPLDQFYKQKGMKDGHLNKCKQCCAEQAIYRKEHNIHKKVREIFPEKECFVCHKIKPLKEFYKQKGMVDGRLNRCKVCCKEYSDRQHKTNSQYYLRMIYNGMRWRCKNVDRYKNLDVLSKEDWIIWCNENMYKFMKLYRQWQNSGYKQAYSPSIDRIDNNKGYLTGNMQWLTLSQNASKSNK